MHDSDYQRQERTDCTETEATDTTPPRPTQDGNCPECGVALERYEGDHDQYRGQYTCPGCLGVWAGNYPTADLVFAPLEGLVR